MVCQECHLNKKTKLIRSIRHQDADILIKMDNAHWVIDVTLHMATKNSETLMIPCLKNNSLLLSSQSSNKYAINNPLVEEVAEVATNNMVDKEEIEVDMEVEEVECGETTKTIEEVTEEVLEVVEEEEALIKEAMEVVQISKQ